MITTQEKIDEYNKKYFNSPEARLLSITQEVKNDIIDELKEKETIDKEIIFELDDVFHSFRLTITKILEGEKQNEIMD